MNKSPLILRIPLGLASLAVFANSQPLAVGTLLVATAKSTDPDFARSVVLLIGYDSRSAVGLMLNKPTNLPVSEVLPDAKGKPIAFFAGGPVTIGVRCLLRSKAPPFFTVITDKSQILSMISGSSPSSSIRVFAGYTGWTAQQLQSEVARGLWKVLPASATSVFDPHPETLWPRLTLPRPIR